jgi:rubrerythrin
MNYIICPVCGYEFDIDEDEECPSCGNNIKD